MRKILNWFKRLLGLPVRMTPDELFEYLCTLDDEQVERYRLDHIRIVKLIMEKIPEDCQDRKDLAILLSLLEIGGPRVCTIAEFMEHGVIKKWGLDQGIRMSRGAVHP